MAVHLVARIDAALPWTTAREMRSISHEASRLSPVTNETCLPRRFRKAMVDGPSTPVVSTSSSSSSYQPGSPFLSL